MLLSRLKCLAIADSAGFNFPSNPYLSCQVMAFCFLAMVWLTDPAPFIGKDRHAADKPL